MLTFLHLYQPDFKVLLITYLKFSKKDPKNARKEEKSTQYAVLLDLKIKNKITNAKNVKKIIKINKRIN